MNHIDTMKLALEALSSDWDGCVNSRKGEAITALREALAEQPAQQEPVVWMEMVVANLVREGVNKHKARELAQHFYTTPPAQRKPLTGEKILHLVNTHVGAPSMSYPLDSSDWMNFARAIEAAHGIKENT